MLPREIWNEILLLCNVETINNVSLTCKDLNRIVNHYETWQYQVDWNALVARRQKLSKKFKKKWQDKLDYKIALKNAGFTRGLINMYDCIMKQDFEIEEDSIKWKSYSDHIKFDLFSYKWLDTEKYDLTDLDDILCGFFSEVDWVVIDCGYTDRLPKRYHKNMRNVPKRLKGSGYDPNIAIKSNRAELSDLYCLGHCACFQIETILEIKLYVENGKKFLFIKYDTESG